MKLSKKAEKDLLQVYDTWWDSYLNGDIKTYDTYLDDDFRFVGSTGGEEFLNRKDTTAFFEATADQLAGKAKLENVIRTIEPLEGMVLITDLADAFILDGTKWVYYARFRFTSLLRNTSKGWRFFYQHFSTPDLKADEGETLGIDKITSENLELRNAIKRRTAELELKNRDLEVEAALERIRAQVTAMNQSSDLLDIVVTMRTEFVKLGHEAHYFWHMRWLPEKYEKAMTSGDGTRIGFVMQLPRYIHGDIPLLANWEKSNDATVVYTMDVDEAIAYIDKMVNLGDFQSIDPQAPTHDDIRHIDGLTFIMARTTHGEIGYSLPGMVKNPPKEDLDILVRFAGAFDLAHKRFEDLRKSEEQARETKIELGLERVRARAMAMQDSSELSQLVDTVFKELAILDFSLQACIINIIDIDKLCNTVWMKSPDVGNIPDSYLLKFEDYPFHDAMKEGYLKREPKYIYTIEGAEKREYDKYLFTDTEFRKISKEAQDSFTSLEKYVCSFTFSNFGGLQTVGEEPLSDENLDILARFGKVFDLTYTRFNDLKLAEAQARESRIELALERVRARTMAMQQSEELGDVATVLFKELNELVENLWTCGFVLCEKDRPEDEWWLSTEEGFIPPLFLPNVGDATHHNIYEAWKNGASYHTEQLEGDALQEHYDWLMTIPAAKETFDDMKASGQDRPSWQKLHCAYFSYGYLVMITRIPCPEEAIFRRFAKVFDQTYTRFLDLQKSEKQAREAEIELALERVRARTMAMQQSEELAEVATVLFQQVKELGIPQWTCGFNIWETGDTHFTFYPGGPDGEILASCKVPLMEHPIFRQFDESKKRGDELLVYEKQGEMQADHYRYMHSLPGIGDMLQGMLDSGLEFPTYQIDHVANFLYGNMIFVTYEPFPEMHEVFIRFAKVFEQTYTRFLDLQKAEAQAREAQIETALERIRSRSIGMQSSEELKDVIKVIFEQMAHLNINAEHAGIVVDFEPKKDFNFWVADNQDIPARIKVPYLDLVWDKQFTEAKEKGKDFFITHLNFEEKNSFYKQLLPHIDGLTKKARDFYFACPGLAASTTIQKDIGIYIENFSGIPYTDEENSILLRIGKVFQQTYTRFLDLQKAEEQAREAQIEAALERVRSRTMAMQKGEELKEVVVLLYKELIALGVTNFASCGYVEINEQTKKQETWVTSPGGDSLGLFYLPLTGDVHFDERYEAWKKGQVVFHQKVAGKERKKHLEYAITTFNSKEAEEMVLNEFPDPTIFYCFNFSHGYLHLVSGSYLNEEEESLLARFTRVFEQTYARFLDLKKAEAQAREAQIETALERVRSRTMAMHNSSELADTAAVLFQQLKELAIDHERTNIGIVDEANGKIDFWLTTQEGNLVDKTFSASIDESDTLKTIYKGYKEKRKSIIVEQKGIELKRWISFITNKLGIPYTRPIRNEIRIQNVGYFSQGMLIATSTNPLNDESLRILERFAAVFEQTYTRFMDLQKAEAQAREAQIEAALEKVRSRSLAMHTTDELQEVVQVVAEKLKDLGVILDVGGAVICTYFPDSKDVIHWTATFDNAHPSIPYYLPYFDSPVFNEAWDSKNSGEPIFEKVFSFEDKNDFFKKAFELSDYKNLPEDYKKAILEAPDHGLFFAWSKNSALMIQTHSGLVLQQKDKEILRRFATVFEQAYIRFMDLQKVEEQAREAQIEAALERVRSKTMAMHNSQDVGATIGAMFDELVKLGIEKSVRCGIGILDHTKPMELWTASSNNDGEVVLNIGFLDMSLHPLLKGVMNAWKKKETNFTYELKGKDLLKYFTVLNESPDYHFHMDLESLPKKTIHNSFLFSEGMLFAFSPHALTEEEEQIFKRFSGVFAQTYTRYLDLLKAEEQAREAQIEAALERVRSQTMAMHNSQDVGKTVVTFFDEVMKLGLNKGIRCGIGILEDREKMETWSATSYPNGDVDLQVGLLDMKRHPLIKGLEAAWKNKEDGYVGKLIGDDVVRYYEQLIEEPDYPFHVDLENLADIEYHRSFFFSSGIIFTFTKTPLSEEAAVVLNRFASVFGQTYRRFLDLQKAEAQAREARVEAALEKVRARTMAMQASSELQEAANLLFLQIQGLGIKAWSAGYNILSEDKTTSTCWMSSEGELQDPFPLFFTEEASFIEMGNFLKSDADFFVQELGGKALKQHYDYMISIPELEDTFKHIQDVGLTLPDYQINHLCKFKQGFLLFITYEKSPEAHDIFKRFTKVFEQTYTRFLDLQKVENQSKEAQIELALERVRASTMAMHKSEQLAQTAQVLFEQFDLLGVIPDRMSIAIFNEKKRAFEIWSTDQNGVNVNHGFDFSIDEPTCVSKTYKAWKEKKKTLIIDLKGKELKGWIRYVKDEVKMEVNESEINGQRLQNFAFFSHGSLLLSTHLPISTDVMKLLQRFAKVFEQTYTRFLDLQRAEAQAREAIKHASIDRVRAEIASMRNTSDLKRITPLIWNELNTLDVPFIRCGVFIMDEEKQQVETHLSTPDGKAIASFNLPFEDTEPLTELLPYWRKKETYKEHWDESAFVKSTKILMERGAIESSESYLTENRPTNLYLHFLPFLQGMLYVGSDVPLNEDTLSLVQNLANAFSAAYSRYEDFNKLELANKKIEKTLEDLKQTQTQLVQSEKMASLGELTAGIAHEIQNPLNFVNNFSEVSAELIDEMNEEMEEGNLEFAKEIASDLKQNLEKINHHGKRAGDIVKGMLQHSRTSSGQKEMTDINALADEYLRLAFHGLRAKDKSFNAKMESKFDPDLPKLEVIPQDIGRVILNMITNAFYVVDEKKKSGIEDYEPTVWVTTNKMKDSIEVSIRDNGKGIPQNVLDKIFQPFFTTKPTGKGTGLGLSLSYDIVKAHGGELKVETNEGEGTEFKIVLPHK